MKTRKTSKWLDIVAPEAFAPIRPTAEVEHEEMTRAAAGAGAALEALRGITIDTDEQALWAGEKLHAVKEHWKSMEERRTSVTKPMNEALRNVNEMFKSVQTPLVEAEAILKSKIGAYQVACRAQQNAALVQASTGDIAALALTAPAIVLPGVTVRQIWDFEVTDPDAVPRQFCSPDPAKIRAALTTIDREPVMTGVRFFKKNQVSSR